MCDHPKIQEQWKSTIGDFYFIRDRLFRPTKAFIVDIYNIKGYAFLPRDANYGWLPRQDQTQEMMGLSLHDLLVQFTKFWRSFYPNVHGKGLRDSHFMLPSTEQLWLAFYMHEKHKLIWSKDKWTKK